jgi:hypothetical protein
MEPKTLRRGTPASLLASKILLLTSASSSTCGARSPARYRLSACHENCFHVALLRRLEELHLPSWPATASWYLSGINLPSRRQLLAIVGRIEEWVPKQEARAPENTHRGRGLRMCRPTYDGSIFGHGILHASLPNTFRKI